jgi:peptidoglycan/xylan/chitin deacetylase (PgdA/CDA1 family)
MLLEQHKLKLRYFRHPYLDTGRDLETRRHAEAFLTERGYHIAPVTVDAWDWMYAGVYDDARERGDTALMDQLAKDYLSYSDTMFAYAERVSKELVGYEPKQILLLHGNWLEADHIGELIEVMRKRGYRFVTLENALSDSVYSLPDTYVGEEGTDWLDHWSITRGKPAQGHPVFPQWVIERSKAIPRPPATAP